MSTEKTCTDSGRRLVDINIGRVQNSGNYTDTCKNNINISVEQSVRSSAGLSGYKRYIHSFSNTCSIGGIYYGDTKQGGFPKTFTYYKSPVIVYYLGYDEGNLVPLLVKLTKSGTTHDYYKRSSTLSTSSQWTRERIIANDSQLSSKLPEISRILNTAIILKIDQSSSGKYYANGDPRLHPPANPTTQVEVTQSTYETVYNKYVHRLTSGGSQIRLLSTKITTTNIPFESPVLRNEYDEAGVYFWNGDHRHNNPLLLELKQTLGTSSYYTLVDGVDKKWNNPGDINVSTLKDKLDQLNCERNKAHQIEISKNSGTSGYQCLTAGCSVSITFVTGNYSYYSRTLHSVLDSSIRRFKNGGTEQTGINSSETSSQVYVYHCPKGPEGIPILIYLPYSSGDWYQRDSLDSNNWTGVTGVGKPTGYNDDPKILKLMKDILPTVTINVGQTGVDSGSSATYSDPSGEDEKDKINVTRKNIDEEDESIKYVGFTHSVQDKDYFILGGIRHENTTLSEISSSSILTSVIVYYYGTEFTLEKLLLIEFKKKNGTPKNYVYYNRGSGGSRWTLDPEQNTELNSTKLTEKLKKLKEKLEVEKKNHLKIVDLDFQQELR